MQQARPADRLTAVATSKANAGTSERALRTIEPRHVARQARSPFSRLRRYLHHEGLNGIPLIGFPVSGLTADGQSSPADRAPATTAAPFFTTKADGTGIGLSLARQILRDHGGNLMLASSLAGTTNLEATIPTT